VPRSVLEDPLDWPLIGHEVAHVLEITHLEVMKSMYGAAPSKGGVDERDPNILKYRYAQEYLSDFIAAYLFGPSFIMRVLATYYVKEIHMSLSHPAWDERIKALIDVGLGKLPGSADYRDVVQTALKGVSLKGGLIPHTAIDLPGAFDIALKRISGKLSAFDYGAEMFKSARDRLSLFLPSTDRYKDVLNAAILDEEPASETYRLLKLGDPAREEKEYRYLVKDCIRLCYVRMQYEKKIATEMEVSEALNGPASANRGSAV
jgi:hypothetical protein